MRAIIGMPVVYSVEEAHWGLFHPELKTFAALVTNTHADGTVDLTFFPPGAIMQHHAENVAAGEGPGQVMGLDEFYGRQAEDDRTGLEAGGAGSASTASSAAAPTDSGGGDPNISTTVADGATVSSGAAV